MTWKRIKCSKCGTEAEVTRYVHFRKAGRATQYEADAVPLCAACRKKWKGHWMWAY